MDSASKLLSAIFRGNHPTSQRAVAATLLAFLPVHYPDPALDDDGDMSDAMKGFVTPMCWESARLGHFTDMCAAFVAKNLQLRGAEGTGKEGAGGKNPKEVEYLLERYEVFVKETGYQPRPSGARTCVRCKKG